jgi:hypothetical protein
MSGTPGTRRQHNLAGREVTLSCPDPAYSSARNFEIVDFSEGKDLYASLEQTLSQSSDELPGNHMGVLRVRNSSKDLNPNLRHRLLDLLAIEDSAIYRHRLGKLDLIHTFPKSSRGLVQAEIPALLISKREAVAAGEFLK